MRKLFAGLKTPSLSRDDNLNLRLKYAQNKLESSMATKTKE